MDEGFLYIAHSTEGLLLYSLSNPLAPVLAGSFATSGDAVQVAIQNNLAFVSDSTAGIQIIDVSNGNVPTHVSTIPTPNQAVAVAVEGDYAYVIDSESGLQVVDVSNAEFPVTVAGYPVLANGITVTNGRALLSLASSRRFEIVDVSTPSNPTFVANLATVSFPLGLYDFGDYVLVFNYPDLQTFDLTKDPPPPASTLILDSSKNRSQVAASNNTAFILYNTPNSTNDSGMWVVDASSPSSLVKVGDLRLNGTMQDICVDNGFAYVAAGNFPLHYIDVSSPGDPLLLGSLPPEFSGTYYSAVEPLGYNCAIIGDISTGVQIISVSIPETPAFVSAFDIPGGAYEIEIEGSYAYVLSSRSLTIFDVTLPWNTLLMGSIAFPYGAYDLKIMGTYAYISGSFLMEPETEKAGLLIIDISDPNAPEVVSCIYFGDYSEQVEFGPNFLYLSLGRGGTGVLDISDPVNPVMTEIISYGPVSAVSDGLLYVGGNPLMVVPPQCSALSAVNEHTIQSRQLLVAYPNPFNPRVSISFYLEEDTQCTLAIFDVAGHQVKMLETGLLQRGPHQVLWDGKTSLGLPAASGTYFARLSGPNIKASRKVTLVR